MAKKSTSNAGTITREPSGAASFIMNDADFRNMGGKLYAGLNILKIDVGQAAGPFVLTKILKDQNLSKKKKLKKGEKPKLIDVYVAEFNGEEIRMPASASFTMKAKESNLSIGDIFALKRGANYKNDHSGIENSQSYELRVISKNSKK